MGEGFGEPQSDACVPAFPEVPCSADEAPSQNIEQQQQQNPQQLMQHHGTSTTATRPERRRRRADAIGSERSVRRRLFEMEERRIAAEDRRVAELGLIRETLQELNELIRDGLEGILMELRQMNR